VYLYLQMAGRPIGPNCHYALSAGKKNSFIQSPETQAAALCAMGI